ncbi:hypothetical protein PM082_004655 [Marasmius tenuissimus]|nr:hypothetical protein PM082_004655 [Marasmius tenuissimus]
MHVPDVELRLTSSGSAKVLPQSETADRLLQLYSVLLSDLRLGPGTQGFLEIPDLRVQSVAFQVLQNLTVVLQLHDRMWRSPRPEVVLKMSVATQEWAILVVNSGTRTAPVELIRIFGVRPSCAGSHRAALFRMRPQRHRYGRVVRRERGILLLRITLMAQASNFKGSRLKLATPFLQGGGGKVLSQTLKTRVKNGLDHEKLCEAGLVCQW